MKNSADVRPIEETEAYALFNKESFSDGTQERLAVQRDKPLIVSLTWPQDTELTLSALVENIQKSRGRYNNFERILAIHPHTPFSRYEALSAVAKMHSRDEREQEVQEITVKLTHVWPWQFWNDGKRGPLKRMALPAEPHSSVYAYHGPFELQHPLEVSGVLETVSDRYIGCFRDWSRRVMVAPELLANMNVTQFEKHMTQVSEAKGGWYGLDRYFPDPEERFMRLREFQQNWFPGELFKAQEARDAIRAWIASLLS